MKSMTMLVMTIPFLLMGSGPLTGADVQLKTPVKIRVEEFPTVASSPKVLDSKNRLMSSPGTVLDSTYYDWQANGGFDDHLAMLNDGGIVKVQGTMTTTYLEDGTDLSMRYYFWNGIIWMGHAMTVFPGNSGSGSMSQTSSGCAVFCATVDLDGQGTRAFAGVEPFPGLYSFSYSGTSVDTALVWPRVTVNSNGSIIITGTHLDAFNGIENNSAWAKIPAPAFPHFGSWRFFSDIAPDWMHDDMEPPTIHSGPNGKVGVVIPDLVGSIRFFESTDYGETFDVLTIAGADTANLPSGLDSTAARLGWINSDILYVDDEPHVVWTAGQGAKVGGQYGLIDFKATIFHWSPSTGIDTVVVANIQSADSTRADYVPTPFNHLSVDWPSIGIQSDGHYITVVFTYLNPNDIDDTAIPPTGYLDIWGAESFDNGNS